MDKYLDQLTYEELDELRFVVMNDNPASNLISTISAAINRKLFPSLEIVWAEVVDEPVVLELVAGVV